MELQSNNRVHDIKRIAHWEQKIRPDIPVHEYTYMINRMENELGPIDINALPHEIRAEMYPSVYKREELAKAWLESWIAERNRLI